MRACLLALTLTWISIGMSALPRNSNQSSPSLSGRGADANAEASADASSSGDFEPHGKSFRGRLGEASMGVVAVASASAGGAKAGSSAGSGAFGSSSASAGSGAFGSSSATAESGAFGSSSASAGSGAFGSSSASAGSGAFGSSSGSAGTGSSGLNQKQEKIRVFNGSHQILAAHLEEVDLPTLIIQEITQTVEVSSRYEVTRTDSTYELYLKIVEWEGDEDPPESNKVRIGIDCRNRRDSRQAKRRQKRAAKPNPGGLVIDALEDTQEGRSRVANSLLKSLDGGFAGSKRPVNRTKKGANKISNDQANWGDKDEEELEHAGSDSEKRNPTQKPSESPKARVIPAKKQKTTEDPASATTQKSATLKTPAPQKNKKVPAMVKGRSAGKNPKCDHYVWPRPYCEDLERLAQYLSLKGERARAHPIKFRIQESHSATYDRFFSISVVQTNREISAFYIKDLIFTIGVRVKKSSADLLAYMYEINMWKRFTAAEETEMKEISYLESLMNLHSEKVRNDLDNFHFDDLITIFWQKTDGGYRIVEVVLRAVKSIYDLCGDVMEYIAFRKRVHRFKYKETTVLLIEYETPPYTFLNKHHFRVSFWWRIYQKTVLKNNFGFTFNDFKVRQLNKVTDQGRVQFIKIIWEPKKDSKSFSMIAIQYPKEGGRAEINVKDFGANLESAPAYTVLIRFLQFRITKFIAMEVSRYTVWVNHMDMSNQQSSWDAVIVRFNYTSVTTQSEFSYTYELGASNQI